MSEKMHKREDEDNADPATFDNILKTVGGLGRFQMTQVALLAVSNLLGAFVSLGFVFQGFAPPHECIHVNETELISTHGLQNDSTAEFHYRSCDVTISTNQTGHRNDVATFECPNGRQFDEDEPTTFVSQWDLVCESSGQAELSYTVFTVGRIVGGLVASYLADRYGRKPVFIATYTLTCLFELLILAAPNICVIFPFKFGSGASFQAYLSIGFVTGLEWVTVRHRDSYVAIVLGIVWTVGFLIIGALAYVLRYSNWKYFQCFTILPALIVLLYPFLLHESPRWLIANNKREKALAILKRASKINGKDFAKVKNAFDAFVAHSFPTSKSETLLETEDKDNDDTLEVTDKHSDTKLSVVALFKNKSFLLLVLASIYIWMTNVFVYFGLFMTSSALAGDRHLNFALLVIVDVPGCGFALLLSKKFGRRIVIAICFGITALSLFGSTLLILFDSDTSEMAVAFTVLCIVGKLSIGGSFMMAFLITPELFPTNVRSTVSGLCNGVSRIALMVSPFMRPLFDIINWGPGLIFTILCIIAIALSLFVLPETKDKELPDTLQEMKDLKKKPTEASA